METEKKIKQILNPILENKNFAWVILLVSVLLMFIENFLKMDELVGGWHIVLYLLLLVPLVYLTWKQEIVNPYTKWFLPVLLLFIVDMFYYSNNMVQYVLPIIFYVLVIVLYLTSMHKVHSLYQTLIPRCALLFRGFDYLKIFFGNLLIPKGNKELYKRIFIALAITIPFLGIFMALLFSADSNFENLLTNMVDFNFNFSLKYLLTVPSTFALYLLFFIYSVSNHKERTEQKETQSLDMLIIGIFLGMIGLLFSLFITIQLPFLFGGNYLPEHESLANFARQGFFQLMMVMGLVMLIFLFIMRRFKGEKIATVLLSFLLIETIVMGLVSLKKMYLYQSIKGATVLRYYVEWFDYFLIISLTLGVLFLVKKLNFSKFLDMVTILGTVAFSLVISLNVEGMVASHNIKKFKNKSYLLDTLAIEQLSTDVLSSIQGTEMVLYNFKPYRECSKFSNYHLGYCSKLAKYGTKQIKIRENR